MSTMAVKIEIHITKGVYFSDMMLFSELGASVADRSMRRSEIGF